MAIGLLKEAEKERVKEKKRVFGDTIHDNVTHQKVNFNAAS